MKIQLKEDQIQKLIGNYKSLNEQGVGFNPETKTETVNFKSVWNSGLYKLESRQIQNLNNQMKVIQDFLSKNPQTKLSIQVEAGESKVTNADNHEGGIPVPEGYLSTKRGQSLVYYLNTYFKKLENGGMSFTYPEIPKPKTIIGVTPYVKGTDDPKASKYTPEQFVRLKVTATSQSECLIGLEVMIGWIKDKGHTCDQAIFQLLMNKVPLGIANLNNGTYDVNGFPPTAVEPDVLNSVKSRIARINTSQVTLAIQRETKKFATWRKDPKNGPSSERKWLDGYKFDGKTIREIGGYAAYKDLVPSYYKENKPNQLTYSDNDIFDEDFLNPDLSHLETMMPYFTHVEVLAARKMMTTFGGETKYGVKYGDQKLFMKDYNNFNLMCYVDIFNKNDVGVNIVEVKATTSNKFLSMTYTVDKVKYPVFYVDEKGILHLMEERNKDVLENSKYLKQRGKLFDRLESAGVYVYDLAFQRFVIEEEIDNAKSLTLVDTLPEIWVSLPSCKSGKKTPTILL